MGKVMTDVVMKMKFYIHKYPQAINSVGQVMEDWQTL
jgi:hypothetical protein